MKRVFLEIQEGMSNKYSKIISRLEKEAQALGGKPQLAEKLGIKGEKSIYRYLNESSKPKADTFCGWLDALGARIVFPEELEALTRSSRVEELLKGKKLDQMSLAELGELFSAIIGLLTDGALRAEIGELRLNPKKEMTIRLDIEPADTPEKHACDTHCKSSESHDGNFAKREAG